MLKIFTNATSESMAEIAEEMRVRQTHPASRTVCAAFFDGEPI